MCFLFRFRRNQAQGVIRNKRLAQKRRLRGPDHAGLEKLSQILKQDLPFCKRILSNSENRIKRASRHLLAQWRSLPRQQFVLKNQEILVGLLKSLAHYSFRIALRCLRALGHEVKARLLSK